MTVHCVQGAGALAILVMAFTAGLGWRRQGWGEDNPVSAHLASLWIVFQPLLFSLIGAEIQVTRRQCDWSKSRLLASDWSAFFSTVVLPQDLGIK